MTPAGETGSDRPGRGLTLDEVAQRLGALVAAKQLEFERLGGWARSAPIPPLKLALARISAHQGWGAVQLAALLPATRDHDPMAIITEQRERLVSDRGALSSGAGGSDPQELAQEAQSALLGLVEAAEHLDQELSPVSDAATRRLLRLVAQVDREDVAALTDPGIAGEQAQVSR